jgi:Zn finger protein HypA/HybF involved in hydrogenase expression
MAPKKELKLAYGLAIVLTVVGVLSFAGYSAKVPDQPLRMMYQTNAGKVLFDHQKHLADDRYGLACADCHHHPEGEDNTMACGDCHGVTENHETIAKTCNECHDPNSYDLAEVSKRSDAFHQQCIGCHQQFDAGPVACNACHVL